MKKIIWSLFDSETAITKELESEKYKVYTIGIGSSSSMTNEFINIDLSKKSCIKKLSKLPIPNIIFASPPCETWVILNIGNVRFFKRNYNEHNLYWQKNFKPNNYDDKHRDLRLLGQKTAYWTYKIIEHFKPELWVIENGQSSYIFKYLYTYFGLEGYKNYARYSAYCNVEFSQKPTIFYSNKKFILRNNVVMSNKRVSKNARYNSRNIKGYEDIKSYGERSKVPIGIYEDIINFYEKKGQQTLF